jgi:hypothetical protein
MQTFTALTLLTVTMLCSCAHHKEPKFRHGSGDAGEFILRHAIARGGQPALTNALPTITGEWRYAEDDTGVTIRLPREQYPTVEALLRQAFGTPKFGPTETVDGGRLGGYRLTPTGGAIQFGYDSSDAQVIVIRRLTQQEFIDGLARAAREMEMGESR